MTVDLPDPLDLLTDFEAHMWQRLPTDGSDVPYVGLLSASASGVMKAQQVPLTREMLRQVGGERLRGRTGQFLVNLALAVERQPAHRFAAHPEVYEPGDQPLLAVCLANVTVTHGDPGPHVDDFEQLPADQVREMRFLTAADGLGTAWSIYRDLATGEVTEVISSPCRPDRVRPGVCHERPADATEDVWITGAIPWSLAVIAADARKKVAALDPAAG